MRQVPSDDSAVERHKQAAAQAAAELLEDGMRVGLGTGSTVAHLLGAIAARGLKGLRCVATSPATEHAARALGLTVAELDAVGELDIAIDGADQIDPRGWLVKGGGAAQTREKIVAAAARRFVVIAAAGKAVEALGPPVPLEVLRFGAERTLAAVGDARLRAPTIDDDDDRWRGDADEGAERRDEDSRRPDMEPEPVTADRALKSPDGNLIADYFGPVGADPAPLAARLSATPGVVEHGLFAPGLVSEILIAGEHGVTRRAGGRAATGQAADGASGRSSCSGATE